MAYRSTRLTTYCALHTARGRHGKHAGAGSAGGSGLRVVASSLNTPSTVRAWKKSAPSNLNTETNMINFKSAFSSLQKIGKCMMLPVSVLPVAGILLGVGSASFSWLPPIVSQVMAQSGGAIFG